MPQERRLGLVSLLPSVYRLVLLLQFLEAALGQHFYLAMDLLELSVFKGLYIEDFVALLARPLTLILTCLFAILGLGDLRSRGGRTDQWHGLGP